ncbi:MAG: hypothetical protein QM775_03070 [Pirellulales bacterium]
MANDQNPSGVEFEPVDVDPSWPLPKVCVLCGCEAAQTRRLRFDAESPKMSFWRNLYGTFSSVLSSYAAWQNDDPVIPTVDLSLPTCVAHQQDSRLTPAMGQWLTRSRIRLRRVHPTFVAALKKQSEQVWGDLSRRLDGA